MNPEIEVRAPAELNCKINFGGSEHDVEPCQYTNRARLNATYFPNQAMSVRWWPKKLAGS
jgi:hypothetical protein